MANGTKVFVVAALMAVVAISASQGQANNVVHTDLPQLGAPEH